MLFENKSRTRNEQAFSREIRSRNLSITKDLLHMKQNQKKNKSNWKDNGDGRLSCEKCVYKIPKHSSETLRTHCSFVHDLNSK